MLVTIHQPHYLPWLGYLHRMARSDVFVLLDHVQFERANYQTRTRILERGEPRWLTVPVTQRSQKDTILEKRIGSPEDVQKHFLTLKHSYREAPYLGFYTAELRRIYAAKWETLVDLNAAALGFLRDAFDIRTPIVRSSELGVGGAKAGLVLNICKALGARGFLAGLGASRHYIDAQAFAREGVRVHYQQFDHPRYSQCESSAAFVPGLSAVDMLFNCGPASGPLLTARAVEEALAA